MRPKFTSLTRLVKALLVLAVISTALIGVTLLAGGARPAHALPEYTDRSGESCGTCHVNPGGGGPRTLRGLLWAAQGRPDEVPALPGMLALPPSITDGNELYDVACAGCHGYQGEGLFAMHLAETGVSNRAIRSFILRGIPNSGMPAFEGQFTEEQLTQLVEFVSGLTSGEIQLRQEYPLPPAQLSCESVASGSTCEGR